jgi:hypothetical protein
MEIDEFIDSYSDDLISLQEGRLALLTHPLRSDNVLAGFVNASFCRMLAVIVVGSIEAMLLAWRERDRVNVLEKYFAKNVQNGDRIQGLYDAFLNAGIPVDRDVFNDYLAIKYLRNTIVHGKWKEYEREWLASRSFPTDSRHLTFEHWARIQHVNASMMLYIALTGHATPGAAKPAGIVKLEESSKSEDPHLGIFTSREIDRILWRNLDRIHSVFGTAIEEAAVLPEYDWTAGQSVDELQSLPPAHLKRRFYLAARRAGSGNCERLVRHRDLADTALEGWRDYYRRVTARSGLDDGSIVESLAVFDDPLFDPTSPHWSILHNLTDSVGTRLLCELWPDVDAVSIEKTVSAFRLGRHAYELFGNLMPVALLGVQLPIVDPARTTDYSQEFDRAYNAVRLGRLWYHCIERKELFRSENLDLYRRLRSDFATH